MTFAQRFLLTLIIVLVLLFALAAIGYFSGRWDYADSAPRDVCLDDTTREAARAIMLTGIDKALEQRILHLFETWMKDSYDQPRRAQAGAEAAIRAYSSSRKGALAWNPPVC